MNRFEGKVVLVTGGNRNTVGSVLYNETKFKEDFCLCVN